MSGLTIDWLRQQMIVDAGGAMPLHAQLRNQLRDVIQERFNDGDRFFGEVQLCEALGLSQTTVRRSLGDLVTEGLLERRTAKGTFVLKADDDATVSIVGIVPDFESSLNSRFSEALAGICRNREMPLSIYSSSRGEAVKHVLESTLGSSETKGFVLIGGASIATRTLAMTLKQRGQRVVVVDIDVERTSVAQCRVDNAAGIDLALQHLTEFGHRRCVMWCGQSATEATIRRRIEVYRDRAKHYKLDSADVIAEQFEHLAPRSISSFFPLVDRILDLKPRPTAILADSDPAAAIVMQRLAQRGVVCPTDMAVVGFNGDPLCELLLPRLTTVSIPVTDIMTRAIDMLLHREKSGTILVKPVLHIRESTSPSTKTDEVCATY